MFTERYFADAFYYLDLNDSCKGTLHETHQIEASLSASGLDSSFIYNMESHAANITCGWPSQATALQSILLRYRIAVYFEKIHSFELGHALSRKSPFTLLYEETSGEIAWLPAKRAFI